MDSNKNMVLPNQWITNFQLFCLIILVRSMAAISLTPVLTSGYTRQDVWIAVLLSIFASFIQLWIVVKLYKMFPTLKIGQIIDHVLGKYLGKIGNFIFVLFFYILAIYWCAYVTNLADVILPETPRPVIKWSFLFVCFYALYKGPASILRSSGFIFISLVGSYFFLVVFLVPEFDFAQFKPILYYGWTPILVGTIVPSVLFFESIMLLQFLPMVRANQWTVRIPFFAHVFAGLLLLVTACLLVMVFGPIEAEKIQFTVFTLVRAISLGDYVERLEFVVIAAWFSVIFFGTTTFIYITREILLNMIKRLNSYDQYVNVGMVLVIGWLVPKMFPDMLVLLEFYRVDQYGFSGFVIAGAFPIILFIVANLRKQGAKL
ncbi:hypothetical protein BHU72_00435 [Desulfuribacillus stibiiarsenatis]|uniref:Uncharacterized protein n=1 Tax=Desulfuribacillus stibiiarsenatis TaxID=1390249 RepID=A0A1E5L9E8_9FIRM|nr:endospore germination permease [Desulfuribacillus stibiiarsenatis]OEH86775.1 hypothetical protein BHU72_00435 [Desulfuribacillus stibiiarsenatis]